MIAAAFATLTLLPGLLSMPVQDLKSETSLPILVPDKMVTEADELYPSIDGNSRRYTISIGAAPDCGGATACFVADFSATKGGRPFGERKVKLTKGRTGRFQPLSCGASCSPPSIEWRERGVVYRLQANVGAQSMERKRLVRMANEAIRRGPR
jgi:hypothetical protein